METSQASPAWTFRLGRIPASTTLEQLRDFFHPEDREFIQIKSLAPAVHNHDRSGVQMATVTFQPPVNSNGRPRLLDNKIQMDDQFHGMTPLYHPEGPIAAESFNRNRVTT